MSIEIVIETTKRYTNDIYTAAYIITSRFKSP